MARQKGDGRGRLGGRPPGGQNKVTKQVREWLSDLIEGNRAQIKRDLKALAPKERLQMLERFMAYVIPKQAAVSASVNIEHLTDAQLENVINELAAQIEGEDQSAEEGEDQSAEEGEDQSAEEGANE